MQFAGIDLHKRILVVCIVNEKRAVVARQNFACSDTQGITAFFRKHTPFRAVMEATAGYEWLWRLLEPLADQVVLAHPKKLRIIAESTTKTDKIDAKKLAVMLALDSIPVAYRPAPRERDHRTLVRARCRTQQRITALKCRLRHLLVGHNADCKQLFTREGEKHAQRVPLSSAERFVFDMLHAEMKALMQQLKSLDHELARFAQAAPIAEQEARAALQSIPSVGPVTIDVVLSELGNIRRFRSAKQVVAYAGLAPGWRESAGKGHALRISKEGSRSLRWALVQLAWRLTSRTGRWKTLYERVEKRAGKKKAIIAVALRVLRVMVSLLKSGQSYRHAAA